MKFEIRITAENTVNIFTFEDLLSCDEIDSFIDDGKEITITSKIEAVINGKNFIKESPYLMGMENCSESILEKNYHGKGYFFSEIITFISNLYYEDEEIQVEINPIDSKYYGKYIDSTYTDEEADEADNERFFFSHFEKEINDYLKVSENAFEALENLFNRCYVPLFKTKELEEQFEEMRVKRWVLESIKEALEETESNYSIDI